MTWEVTVFADNLFHKVTVLLSEDGTIRDAVDGALEHVDESYVGLVAIVARPQDEAGASQTFEKTQPENGEAS